MMAYSVDRTENIRIHQIPYELPPWAQTKWHRASAADAGVAACSCRIVLNPEDALPADSPLVGDLCRRCFR